MEQSTEGNSQFFLWQEGSVLEDSRERSLSSRFSRASQAILAFLDSSRTLDYLHETSLPECRKVVKFFSIV
uniref:Uncharacterized protein n=1 Tax=Glossina morsitans morsitans TaxID=37546 RepID=A0A1B0GCU4_GLOMM